MKTLFVFTLLLSAFMSFNTQAAPIKKNVLVSVGEITTDENSPGWKKSVCDQVYTIANQVVTSGVNVVCRNFDTSSILDKGLENIHLKYDYHLRILKDSYGVVGMDVNKLQRKNSSDFKTLAWTMKDGANTKITKEQAMAKAIGNFFFYVDNELAYKAALLVNGAQDSDSISYDQKKGVFLDRFTNEPISINRAYSQFEGEGERHMNYLRTGVEIGVLLSSAMAIYYKNLVFNQVDFDYGLKDGIRKKLNGDAIRLDDNDKSSNYGHEYAGVMYYQMARSNGFNSLESFLITFASSTAWEFMEYHEVLSINDEIMTPIGGYVIGEATYQISCALNQKNSLAAKTLGYTINPGLAANHAIDAIKSKNKFASQPDCQKPRWSDISVYMGVEQGSKPYVPTAEEQKGWVAGMDATVVPIADYNKEGKGTKLIYDTAMAKMLVELNGNQGVTDLRVVAQLISVAYNTKDITRDEKGQLRGYDVLVGVGTASTWNDRGTKEDSDSEDFFGTINVLGATASASIFKNGFHIKADVAFYGDFAMVKSYSLSKYRNENPGAMAGQASTISKHNYYWGAGASTIASIAVEKGKWEVGYNGQFSSEKSLKGNHRLQEEITTTDVYRDTMSVNRHYIKYSITKNLQFQISREYYKRSGSVNNGSKTTGTEVRTMGTLIYKF
jgi:hypothetical protein